MFPKRDVSAGTLTHERKATRRRIRRRRALRGLFKTVFWALVLGAVFIFGIGFGRVIGGDDSQTNEEVVVTQDRGVITSTLPVRTITTTKTVTKTVRRPVKKSAKNGGNNNAN